THTLSTQRVHQIPDPSFPINNNLSQIIMPLHKEIDQPLCSLSSRTLLNRLNKKRVRIILRLHRTSNTNSCPIRTKTNTNHTPTNRNITSRDNKGIPRRSINSLRPHCAFIPAPKTLTNEHLWRHSSKLISHSRSIQPDTKRRVSLSPLSTQPRLSFTCCGPLNPSQTPIFALNTSGPCASKHITVHTGGRGSS